MTAILHIHAQQAPHDEAFVVGNRQGLLALRQAIDAALESGQGETAAFAADGEGFSVFVILQPGGLGSPGWIAAAVPYSGEWAAENRESAVWPHSQIKKDQF